MSHSRDAVGAVEFSLFTRGTKGDLKVEPLKSPAANACGTTCNPAVAGSSPVFSRKTEVAQLVEHRNCFTPSRRCWSSENTATNAVDLPTFCGRSG